MNPCLSELAILHIGGEDSFIRLWDVETGKVICKTDAHKKQIQHLCLSDDMSHFISARAVQTRP